MIEVIVRAPRKNDVDKIMKFYNKVIKETEFLSRITPVKRKDEAEWVKNMIKENKNKMSVCLLAEHNGKIIGSSTAFTPKAETNKHICNFGICILQEYTGIGLGKKFSQMILELAKKNLKSEIAFLWVYDKNKVAQNLYKKIGFVYSGKIPRGIKRKGKYMDDILMYKVLK